MTKISTLNYECNASNFNTHFHITFFSFIHSFTSRSHSFIQLLRHFYICPLYVYLNLKYIYVYSIISCTYHNNNNNNRSRIEIESFL